MPPEKLEHIRAAALRENFVRDFGVSPKAFILRAPGRINLIGEHTDYNGLPVLPIAINRDIMLAARPRDDSMVRIHNVDRSYEPRGFEISEKIKPYPPGDWGNYAKAAAQALQGAFPNLRLRGLDALVDGNIPVASGLASSSALVVATALALQAANSLNIDRSGLAELLARGEQYVGTRGGGMDQAICLFAEEGCGLKIDFFPTRIERIPIPRGYNFVVCRSMTLAPKASTARIAYNLRTAESHIAAALLGKVVSETTGAPRGTMKRLGDLYSASVGLAELEINSLMERAFEKETYLPAEVSSLLNMGSDEFRRLYFGAFAGSELDNVGSLKLPARARHVISEGRRVRKAANALLAGRMDEFGALMYASHESCAEDYEISTPELDALVAAAREAGALGARLTGAGFGGCVICLVRERDVEEFVEVMKRECYGNHPSGNDSAWRDKNGHLGPIFACRATARAGELFK